MNPVLKARANRPTSFRGTPIVWVKIEPTDEAFLVLGLDAHGAPISDTWHLTLVGAQRQALLQFGVAEADWVEEPVA